jgi:hypothetical protein
MISRSFFDSKIGLTICSPHCSERFDATREPDASNCVQAGNRYMPSLRPASTASDAQVVGCGSATTRRSSLASAFSDSGMRVMLLLACPCTNIARRLSFWSTWSFGSRTASNHRVSGIPGVSMIFFESKRDCRSS